MNKLKKLIFLITLTFALMSSFLTMKVFADADKTELTNAYNLATAAVSTQNASLPGDPYYEVNSYQAFDSAIQTLGGLSGIQDVINDSLALQDDVNTLATNVFAALLGLILNDTYYATLANFSLANTIDLSPYTSDSQILYNNELDRIELILNNPTAGEIAIQNLNNDIDNANSILVLRGDKTLLNSLILQIDTIYNGLGLDYIPSTFSEFKTGYDNIDNQLNSAIGMNLQTLVNDIDALVSEVQTAETYLNDLLAILVIKPDKSQLISDYSTATNVDSNLYTTSSYILFTNGLSIINSIINDQEATQTDVDKAILDLANLYSLLIVRADTTNLQIAYDQAISIDLTNYTPNSITLYQNELARINQIILSADTDQTLADQALADILNAQSLLVLIADKTDLDALNNILIRTYYENTESYTKSSHNAFKLACDAFGSYLYVNLIINDDNATEQEVLDLEDAIRNALSVLVLKVNNEGLLIVYYDLIEKDLSNYTLNSQIAYHDELDRLYVIIIGDELDSQAAAQVLLDLSIIDELLVELADYSQLILAISKTNIYREEDYSISSYAIFKSAKMYAENMTINLNATQEEIDNAITSLQNAIGGLQNTIEPLYIKEGKSIDLMQYITLGQAMVLEFEIDNSEIIQVNNQGIITGLQHGTTNISVILSNGAIEVIEVTVIAKVTTPVYVLTFTIPVLSLGLGAFVMFGNKTTMIKLFTNFKNIFVKKR